MLTIMRVDCLAEQTQVTDMLCDIMMVNINNFLSAYYVKIL
jgi:hypothetical protein